MAEASRTTDHDEIRRWTEARGGRPAVVADTYDGEGGVLRIDFQEPDESLQEISWDEFFRIFDGNGLAFLYQDEDDSRFFKLVQREEGE